MGSTLQSISDRGRFVSPGGPAYTLLSSLLTSPDGLQNSRGTAQIPCALAIAPFKSH